MENQHDGFASSSLTAGQLNAMVKGLGGAEAAKVFSSSRDLQLCVAKVIADWGKRQGVEIRRLTQPVPCLVSASTRNLVDFYQTSVGLWLSLNFKNRILKEVIAGKVKTPKANLNHADFVQAANDAEICKDMPVGYVFKDRDLFLGYLSILISSQPGGSAGPLLHTDFKANIFHVEFEPGVPFAVNVYWDPRDSQWRCRAGPHVSYRWRAGGRVFGNCV